MAHETGKITWDAKLVGEDVKRFLREGTKLLKRMNDEWKKMGTEVRRTGDAHRRVEKDTTGPLAKMRNQVLGIATAWRTVHEALALARAEYGFMVEKQQRAAQTGLQADQAYNKALFMLHEELGMDVPWMERWQKQMVSAGVPKVQFYQAMTPVGSAAALGIGRGAIESIMEKAAAYTRGTGQPFEETVTTAMDILRMYPELQQKPDPGGTALGLLHMFGKAMRIQEPEMIAKMVPKFLTVTKLHGGTIEEAFQFATVTTGRAAERYGAKAVTAVTGGLRTLWERKLVPYDRFEQETVRRSVGGVTVPTTDWVAKRDYMKLPPVIQPGGEAPGWQNLAVMGAMELNRRGYLAGDQRENLAKLETTLRSNIGAINYIRQRFATWAPEEREKFLSQMVGGRSEQRAIMRDLLTGGPVTSQDLLDSARQFEFYGGVEGASDFYQRLINTFKTAYSDPMAFGETIAQQLRGEGIQGTIGAGRDFLEKLYGDLQGSGWTRKRFNLAEYSLDTLAVQRPRDVWMIVSNQIADMIKQAPQDQRETLQRALRQTMDWAGPALPQDEQYMKSHLDYLMLRGLGNGQAPTTQPAVPTTQPAETEAGPAGGVSSAINRLTDFLDAMQLNTMNGPQGYPAARTPMATVFA